ncbi:MAG: hypothetical protein AB7S68_15305 [Polyangiaceae bacterium]
MSALIAPLLVMACATSAQQPAAPIQVPVVSAEQEAKPAFADQAWTKLDEYRLWLPVTPEEFDQVRFETSYVGKLKSRVVWLNGDDPKAQAMFDSIDAPVGLTLNDSTPEVLDAVDRLATRVPVALHLTIDNHSMRVERLPHVQRLHTWVSSSPDGLLPDLGKLRNLEELELPGSYQLGKRVVGLTPHLSRLSMKGTLGEDAFPHLLRLIGLRTLRTGGFDVPVPLDRFPQLEELTYPLTDATLPALARLEHLETLHIVNCDVSDEAVAGLAKLSRLKRVTINACRPSEALMSQIAALPQLESFEGQSLSAADALPLRSATRLTSLRLPFLSYGSELDELLKSKPHLKELDLGFSRLPPEVLDTLLELKDLEYLDITSAEFFEGNISGLSELKKLRVLRARATAVGDYDLRNWVEGLSELRELDLFGTEVTASDVSELIPASKLRWLRLPDHAVNKDTVAQLNRIPSLVYLRFSRPDIPCHEARSGLRVPIMNCDEIH